MDSSRPPQMPRVQPEAIGSTHRNEAEKTTAMSKSVSWTRPR